MFVDLDTPGEHTHTYILRQIDRKSISFVGFSHLKIIIIIIINNDDFIHWLHHTSFISYGLLLLLLLPIKSFDVCQLSMILSIYPSIHSFIHWVIASFFFFAKLVGFQYCIIIIIIIIMMMVVVMIIMMIVSMMIDNIERTLCVFLYFFLSSQT